MSDIEKIKKLREATGAGLKTVIQPLKSQMEILIKLLRS